MPDERALINFERSDMKRFNKKLIKDETNCLIKLVNEKKNCNYCN